jgi:hypothetical protein
MDLPRAGADAAAQLTVVQLVTPVPYRLSRPLGEGLGSHVICRDDRAQQLMSGAPGNLERCCEQASQTILNGEHAGYVLLINLLCVSTRNICRHSVPYPEKHQIL